MPRQVRPKTKAVLDSYLETGSPTATAREVGMDPRAVSGMLTKPANKAYVDSVRNQAKVDIRIASRNERLAILSDIARAKAGETPTDQIAACRLIAHMQGELSVKATVEVRNKLDFASMPLEQVLRIARGEADALPSPEDVIDV